VRLKVQVTRNHIGDTAISEVVTSMEDMDNIAAKVAGSVRRWLRGLTWRDKPYDANFSITAQWLEGDKGSIIQALEAKARQAKRVNYRLSQAAVGELYKIRRDYPPRLGTRLLNDVLEDLRREGALIGPRARLRSELEQMPAKARASLSRLICAVLDTESAT
jgi:hypothetical protein